MSRKSRFMLIAGVAAVVSLAGVSASLAQIRLPRNLPQIPVPAPKTTPAPTTTPAPAETTPRPKTSDSERAAVREAGREKARADRAKAAEAQAQANAPRGLPAEDQGILNPMHQANIGKVVFTSRDFTIDAINPGVLVNSIEFGQPAYFRVYMARSAVNEMMGKPGVSADRNQVAPRIQYRAKFTVSGQVVETTFNYFGTDEERNRYTTWRGQFINRDPFSQRLPGSDIFRELVTKGSSRGLFRPGTTSQVTMEVIPLVNPFEGEGPPVVGPTIATGTFNLRMPAGGFNRNDPYVCVPGGASEPAIERAALAKARQAWLARDAQPVAARMGMDPWEIKRNELTGIPIERDTTVLIIARAPDSSYCWSTSYYWREPFAGGGFSTAMGDLYFRPFVRTYFPCSCIS